MVDTQRIKTLEEVSKTYRKNVITLAREHTFGLHLGGSLSLSELLSVLYFYKANVNPDNPNWVDRDRIILSKGHANVGLMIMLAMRGFFPLADLQSFNQFGSMYSMHADVRVPGVEHSSGSLGHGVTVAVGMALSAKLLKEKWKVYCIVGDGEMMEGSVWESLMSAANFKLDNLTYIIDRNRLSQESLTEDEMALEPLAQKLSAFGLHVCDIDGHDVHAIVGAFDEQTSGKPKAILARTIKGYGVPGYAGFTKSHFANLTGEEYQHALQELGN